MNTVQLCKEIKASIPDLDKEWKERYGLFLTDENLSLFSKNLIACYNQKFEIPRMPYFKEEIIISLQEILLHFKNVFEAFENSSPLTPCLINTLENTPFGIILIILGQRLTSASSRDETAIPPAKEILLESCFQSFNNEVAVAVRAWEKHVGRKKDSIFGVVKGNSKQKQETVEELIQYIMSHTTWWNVFYHYKHGLVYEIRVASGQGMRWSADGKKFIGFLEDFIEEKNGRK